MGLSYHALVLPLLAASSLIMTSIYVVDLIATSQYASTCEMTYSWPVYTPLATTSSVWKDTAHYKYSLYAVHMHAYRPELTGIPVLFIPGHMGSHQQARSFARHLYDLDDQLFDVFAVAFDEELTGLNGQFVHEQAKYVNDVIRVILKQYAKQIKQQTRRDPSASTKRKIPESVVIFGHSMGGVVARVAETLPNHKRKSIQHVISLGSPYAQPAFPFDADLQSMYRLVDASLSKHPSETVYISIAGGHKDTTVHASHSLTDRIAPSTHTLALLATALPKVDATIDHLCLLWCHQLLKEIASSLKRVVDLDTRVLLRDADERFERVRDHFLGELDTHNATLETLAMHRAGLRDGYYSPTEFARYGLVMPQFFVTLFRGRYTTLFTMMYAIVLHIFHLQIRRWQSRFDVQSKTSGATSSLSLLEGDPFLSFTSMLHPAAHAPAVITSMWSALESAFEQVPQAQRLSKTSVMSTLATLAMVVVGVLVELSRRYRSVAAVTSEAVVLTVLYIDAIGLLYTISLLFALIRAILSPLLRVVFAITRRVHLHRSVVIIVIYVLVVVFGHVREFELIAMDSTARALALLVLASVVVFVLHVIEMGLGAPTTTTSTITSDQERYRTTLFAFYLLSSIAWIGKVVYFLDLVRYPSPHVGNDLLVHASSCIVVLALFRYFITKTESEMIPLPPTAFFDMNEGDSYGSSSSTKLTAETCPRCVFEDGGPGAVFIEYEEKPTTCRWRTRGGEIVTVGPTFRVVSCDCVYRFQQPREYCAFCTRSCRLCGGGNGNYQEAQRFQEYLAQCQTQRALHSIVATSLELCALVLLVVPMSEHFVYYMTPAITIVLVVYHTWLRHPIEAKRMLKEQRKLKNKSKDAAAKNKAKKKKQRQQAAAKANAKS